MINYFSRSLSGLSFSIATLSTMAREGAAKRPQMIYGTAWKKDRTAELVELAISKGFRAIDTACQPKHYQEDLVGEGIRNAVTKYGIARDDIWVQTKFTSVGGQDTTKPMPYDPKDPLEKQVEDSWARSKKNLEKINSLVMHSPMPTMEQTLVVWRKFEEFHDRGEVQELGVSNCYDPDTFKEIYEKARVKPVWVQNRFYSDSGWDHELRAFLREKDIGYQSFWTLTANPQFLQNSDVLAYGAEHNLSDKQVLYKYCREIGITPLTGTTSELHMGQDLTIRDQDLSWNNDMKREMTKALLGVGPDANAEQANAWIDGQFLGIRGSGVEL